MRHWMVIVEEFSGSLSSVTGADVRNLYASIPKDLETLLSAYEADTSDFLDTDWSADTERLKRVLRPLENQELILYRAIKGKPDLNHLGIHWSLDKETAVFGESFMTALVPPTAVDWVGTIARGIHWWEDEQEITLLSGFEIEIISITDTQGINPPAGPMKGII